MQRKFATLHAKISCAMHITMSALLLFLPDTETKPEVIQKFIRMHQKAKQTPLSPSIDIESPFLLKSFLIKQTKNAQLALPSICCSAQ